MVCEAWSVQYATSLFYVILLSKLALCSFHGNEDENMDNKVKSIMDSLVTYQQHGTPTHVDRTLKSQKPHVKMKTSQITDNHIAPVKLSKSAKEPYWFNKVLSSYRTTNLQTKMYSYLQSRNKEVLVPFEILQSSSFKHPNKQPSSEISSLPDKQINETKFDSYHNLFPTKRKKRYVPAIQMSSGENELNSSGNAEMYATARTQSVHVTRREVGDNLNKTTKMSSSTSGVVNKPKIKTSLPLEWTPEGNYSAVWKIWRKYSAEKAVAREAQIAFLCTVFLLCLLSWAVWVTGMCHRRKVKYREWNFQESHATVTMADILKRRWKYLPEESFYEEVIVHDRGTDP